MASLSRKRILRTVAAVAVAISLGATAACGVNTQATGGNEQQTSASSINYALWSNPNGLFNPITYFTDYDRDIIFNVYDRLLTVDNKQQFQGSLAKSYKWGTDKDGNSTLTFVLRDDVTWHDGEPFTADDVAFTYTAPADRDYPADVPELVKHLLGYEDYHSGKVNDFAGISTPDKHTVVFTFTEPYSAALPYFADRPVLAKHVWQDVPLSQWNQAGKASKNPIGTGPYKFKEFKDGEYVSLEANEHYFKGAPKTKKLIFKVVNPDVLQTAVINGEVDIAEISNFNDKELQAYKDAGVKIQEGQGTNSQYLTLDVTNPKLADKRVRQAIAYGIDKQSLVDSLLYGHGTTFAVNALSTDPNYPDGLNDYKHDVKKAKNLLAQAGWTDTDGDGFVDKDGKKFTFEIDYPSGNKTRELSAPIIQQNLKDIGIDATLKEADFNTTLAILQDSHQRYDGVLMGNTFRPSTYGGINWWARWALDGSAEATALDKATRTTDGSEQRKAVGDYLKLENDEVPFVPLYISNEVTAVRSDIKGFQRSTFEIFSHVTDWSKNA